LDAGRSVVVHSIHNTYDYDEVFYLHSSYQ